MKSVARQRFGIQIAKSALVAGFLVLLLFGTPVCAQVYENGPAYEARELLPLLRPFNLDGLAKAVRKRDDLSAREVNISLGHGWGVLPFTRFRVDLSYVLFWSSDERWYVFCPCKPPTLEQLTKARTMNEVLELLAPAAKTSPDIRTYPMNVGTMIDNLNNGLSWQCEFHTAYLVDDRLMWITCRILYAESDKRKTADTPFADSNIVISRSPRLK